MEEVWNTDRMDRNMKRWTVAVIPVISAVGSLMHFVYDWSGGLLAVGLLAPVNESIWEHLKLLFWPTLVWWVLGYLLFSKNEEISEPRWICSASVGLFSGPLFITAFYYTYTGAFGFHSLFLDILSFVLGTAVAQLSGLRLYPQIKTARSLTILAAGVIVLLGAAFLVFTFFPPEIPLFEDAASGSYGI
jgi:hypothetical protein